MTIQEAQGIKKQLGNENEVVLGAFDFYEICLFIIKSIKRELKTRPIYDCRCDDFYCEKKKDEKEKKKRKGKGEGEEDTSCDAVLAHQLKLILSEEQKKDK